MAPPLPEDLDNPYKTKGYYKNTPGLILTIFYSQNKIKKDNIGTFNPYYLNPDIFSIILEGKNVIFTNMYIFINRIVLFIDDNYQYYLYKKQFINNIQTLFLGVTINQQQNKLLLKDYYIVYNRKLLFIITVLKDYQALDPKLTNTWFTKYKLYLINFTTNKNTLSKFFSKKI